MVFQTTKSTLVEWVALLLPPLVASSSCTTFAANNGEGSALNQLRFPRSIRFNAAGALLVADVWNNRIVSWAEGDAVGTVVAGNNGGGAGLNQLISPQFMIPGDSDSVIVTDSGNHRVMRWASGASAGTVVAGGNGAGSGNSQFDDPKGLALDSGGNLYIADRLNHRIMRWEPGAAQGTLVAGGNGAGSGANQLQEPAGLVLEAAGDLYIADMGNHRIVKWTPGESTGTVVAGGNGGGSALNQLNAPNDVAVDSSGNIYVADQSNQRLVKWGPGSSTGEKVSGGRKTGGVAVNDASGKVFASINLGDGLVLECSTVVTCTTFAGHNGANGAALNQLYFPKGIALDSAGRLLVADLWNQRVVRWAVGDSSGTLVAGGNGAGSNLNQLKSPYFVLSESSDAVIVGEAAGHRVVEWSSGASTGSLIAGGNQGSALNQLDEPSGIAKDGSGDLYIADMRNHRVVKWVPGGSTGTVVAGNNGPGSGTNQLNLPRGLAIDATGDLYICDSANHRVMKWTPGGSSGTVVAGGNGQGSALNQLNGPNGVALDSSGNVYVGDENNYRAVRWAPGGAEGEVLASTGALVGIAVDEASGRYFVSANEAEGFAQVCTMYITTTTSTTSISSSSTTSMTTTSSTSISSSSTTSMTTTTFSTSTSLTSTSSMTTLTSITSSTIMSTTTTTLTTSVSSISTMSITTTTSSTSTSSSSTTGMTTTTFSITMMATFTTPSTSMSSTTTTSDTSQTSGSSTTEPSTATTTTTSAIASATSTTSSATSVSGTSTTGTTSGATSTSTTSLTLSSTSSSRSTSTTTGTTAATATSTTIPATPSAGMTTPNTLTTSDMTASSTTIPATTTSRNTASTSTRPNSTATSMLTTSSSVENENATTTPTAPTNVTVSPMTSSTSLMFLTSTASAINAAINSNLAATTTLEPPKAADQLRRILEATQEGTTAAIRSMLNTLRQSNETATATAIAIPSASLAAVTYDTDEAKDWAVVVPLPEEASEVRIVVPLSALNISSSGSSGAGEPSERIAMVVTVFNPSTVAGMGGVGYVEDRGDGDTGAIAVAEDSSIEVKAAVNVDLVSVDSGRLIMVGGLVEPIEITLPVNYTTPTASKAMLCAFWDDNISSWSTEGVSLSPETVPGFPIKCLTTHLSLFGAILQSYAATILCSRLSLMNAEATGRLLKGKWYKGPGAVMLWNLLGFLLASLSAAWFLDCKRDRKHHWTDQYLLVPVTTYATRGIGKWREENAPDEHSDGELTEELTEEHPRKSMILSLAGCCVSACCTAVQWLSESSSARDAIDDIIASWCANFGELRSGIEAFCQGLEASVLNPGQVALVGNRFTAHLILMSSRRLTAAQLQLTDDVVKFVLDSETLHDYLVDRTMRRASSIHSRTSQQNAESEQRPSVNSLQWNSVQEALSEALQRPSANSFQAILSGVETWRPILDDWRANGDPKEAWFLLHKAVVESMQTQSQRHGLRHSLCTCLELFFMHTYFGSALLFNVFSTAKMRVLLSAAEILGSMMLAAVFFEVSGSVRGRPRESERLCVTEGTAAFRIGRFFAIATMSSLLGAVPIVFLQSLQTRTMVEVEYPGCPEWHRKLRVWRLQDLAVCTGAVLYMAFSIFFISTVLANIAEEDQAQFAIGSAIALLQDFIGIPMVVAGFLPSIGSLLLHCHSIRDRVSQADIIRRIQEQLHRETNVMLPLAQI